MPHESMTIRQLLNKELARRVHISGIQMTADDLFDKDKVSEWVRKLIGKTHADLLDTLIEASSVERLGHAAATYLLGMAMREQLDLPFDLLPKLITSGTCEGFHFFWALVCLCHDLGYQFEHQSENDRTLPGRINNRADRADLLKIKYDLMELETADLIEMGLNDDNEQRKWILESAEMIKNYDAYRRKADPKVPQDWPPVIDHGITGSLLMYDLLRKEYDQMLQNNNMGQLQRHGNADGMLGGTAHHTTAKHFITSSLMIACTVGRHNMWLPTDDNAKSIYKSYKLDKLADGAPASLVRADTPLEQMLFLLDFLDTIDPVKGIYLRPMEKAGDSNNWTEAKKTEMKLRRDFMLDQVKIRFVGDYTREKEWERCRWGNALTYRKIELFVEKDVNDYFRNYASGTAGLNGWLMTRKPDYDEDNRKITYYMPAYRGRGNCWPYGITDQEVNALLLYQGCGVPGKYGDFYSPAEAYQAFNLLMMPGMEGERVRIFVENQKPNSVYISNWKKTLNIMMDIFTAQCKYSYRAGLEGKQMTELLYRSDRELNLSLMGTNRSTFAFTSTSRVEYNDEFLRQKKDPRILQITLGKDLPYFDYEAFFAEQYINSREREILLPPLLKITADEPLAPRFVEGLGEVESWAFTLGGFDLESAENGFGSPRDPLVEQSEDQWIDDLDSYADAAANALKQMTDEKTRDMSIFEEQDHPYWKWKNAFQRLTLRCMGNIYKSYFGSR